MQKEIRRAPTVLLLASVALLLPIRAGAATNLALHAQAVASSVLEPKYSAGQAVDGRVSNDSRWVSARTAGPHSLRLEFPTRRTLGCVQIVTGWIDGTHWTGAATNFVVEYRDGANWLEVPGARSTTNSQSGLNFVLKEPVATDRLRFVSADAGPVRVVEFRAFAPAANYPPVLAAIGSTELVRLQPFPLALVNQSGYNVDWPKRFTAPTTADGTPFVVTRADSTQALFRGNVSRGVGDFTDFQPRAAGHEFVVRVNASSGSIVSDPFTIAPLWLERVSLEPALRFFVDARSVVGSHASAFGGGPWRDGPYYTYDVPSLVLLYLANPGYFENARIEMNHAADAKRILDPGFKLAANDAADGALEAARRYYRELDPPVGERVPDLIQLIHWGIGYLLMHPENFDFSADPAGRRIHPQQVEKFAFFLYGYPLMRQYFTDAFYWRARDFAFNQWEKVGLCNVLTNIGDFKGRECPGHSILPNLLMFETAKRESHKDAARYLTAAVNQARWVVDELDFDDPRVSKGQRMSEHMLITGLVTLLREYPERAPAGLKEKLARWAQIMIARSDNLWDFRRYDAEHWTLPRFAPGTHGGAGWNEPGNVAAFPALALGVASILEDAKQAARLEQLAASHWDDLFGRNPLGAHSAYQARRDFIGVERGFPKKFPDNVCARLETVRGTLNSTASGEQYPFNPGGAFRHVEGWVAFNAAFNVGLAYTCWADTRVSLHTGDFKGTLTSIEDAGSLGVQLFAPVAGVSNDRATARVVVSSSSGDFEPLVIREERAGSSQLRGIIPMARAAAQANDGVLQIARGGTVTFSYGGGFWQQRIELPVR